MLFPGIRALFDFKICPIWDVMKCSRVIFTSWKIWPKIWITSQKFDDFELVTFHEIDQTPSHQRLRGIPETIRAVSSVVTI